MKILKNLLSLVLGVSIGLCLVAFSATPSVQSPSADLSNPFCGQITPPCPFFDPCEEGSHVDVTCSDSCCRTYQASVTTANNLACLLYGVVLIDYTDGLQQISDDFADCLSNGVSPDICVALRKASIAELDKGLADSKLGVQHILQAKLDRALAVYFNCLLACPCIEDPVIGAPISK